MMKTISKFFSAIALVMVLAGSFLALPAVSLAQQETFTNSRGWNCTENPRGVRSTTVTAVCVTNSGDYYRCSYTLSASGERSNETCTDTPYQNIPPQPQANPPAGQPVSQPAQTNPTQPNQPAAGQNIGNGVVTAGIDTVSGAFTEAQFVPLTNLPGFQNVTATDSLPDFLNQLYRLCIGAAAVIAVLQIMRAGVLHMFNKGSLSQSQNVRSLIQNSLLGLLLVLSPAIVFGIINPDILDISLNFGAIAPDELERVSSDSLGNTTLRNAIQTGCSITLTDDQSRRIDQNANTLERQYANCVGTNGNTAASCEAAAQTAAQMAVTQILPNSANAHACVVGEIVKHAKRVTGQSPTFLTQLANQIAQQCGVPALQNSRTECIRSEWAAQIQPAINACVRDNPGTASLACYNQTVRATADRVLQGCVNDMTPTQRQCVIDRAISGQITMNQTR